MADQTTVAGRPLPRGDRMTVRFAKWVLRWRWLVIAFSVVGALGLGSFGSKLELASDYRVFFSDENPELVAFEAFQATYTKSDNILFVIEPKSGDAFSPEALAAVQDITREAWKLPYASRVDSITNFQSTQAEGDELIVADLVSEDPSALSKAELDDRRARALAEPLVKDQLLKADGSVTAVNVVMYFPQESADETPEAVAAARALRDEMRAAHPEVGITLTGVAMLNNAFNEAGLNDLTSLVPLMYVVLLVIMAVSLRSITAMGATLVVIVLSSMAAMGSGGLLGYPLTPVNAAVPTIVMTLAIADSIHVLVSMRVAMRRGMEKHAALIEAVRVNFLAIVITSVTTIVGFLALNFSDAPPFWHLGNMTAIGILAALIFSVTTLPAVVSLLPIKTPAERETGPRRTVMTRLADFVIERYRTVFVLSLAASIALVAMIPRIEFNDAWLEYFDQRIEFRRASDAASEHFGLYPVEFSVPSGRAGGVSEPEFLARLEAFTEWLRAQPHVTHVYSLVDIMKRLNKNMHADDESYFRVPDDRELSAQYLLLYEISLPFGLDLNDRIDIDKAATRVSVTLGAISTTETKTFLNNARAYIAEHFPEDQRADPTSPQVMFTYIAQRNIDSMITGTIIAIAAISLIMILALRSVPLGLLSLVPNGLPIAATFGAWALLIGEVGFSVSAVASVSLGIVVDDTVHLLTKFQRARREHGYGVADAIRYSFDTVGVALVVNTIILVGGFMILTLSAFKANFDMGVLTALAIVLALVLDFLLLPSLLLLLRRDRQEDARAYGVAAQAAE